MAVSLLLLAWALHDVRLAEVLAHARRADAWRLAGVVVLATLTFPLRTVRWRLILRDIDARRLPWTPLWHATAVGFMANNLLPVRAGEVARAYVVSRQAPVRFTTAFASVGVERVFDGLVLMAFMAIAISARSFPSGATLGGTPFGAVASGLGLLFGAALVVALLVVHRPAPWLRVVDRLAGRLLPARFAGRVMTVLEGLVAGLAVLRHAGRFAAVVGWSFVLWGVNAASFALCFGAFGIPLPFEAAFLLQGVIALGVAIPSSPGFWGVFEAATRLTLGVYAVGAGQAVSYAVVYHLTTFVPITLLGLYSLSRVHVRLRDLGTRDADGRP